MNFMLGSAAFGNEYKGIAIGKYDCFRIMEKAWSLGITTIDTARSYGMSETIIAEYIKATGNHFKVYTKGRSHEDFQVSAQVLGSNLYAKLWHFHPGDTIDCQVDGVSCYGDEWFDIYGETDINIVQFPWNIIDRRHEESVTCARGYGIQTICRSVFIRGQAFNMPPIAGAPFWVWCLQNMPDFDYVIIGADNPEQLSEIVTSPLGMEVTYADSGVNWRIK